MRKDFVIASALLLRSAVVSNMMTTVQNALNIPCTTVKWRMQMHELAIQEVIKICRQREQEGDCPTIKAPSVETLEDVVIQIANECGR